mmetsp:Transcript_14803/g.42643  ORF Transcript_14803/g.42643 Transcript_14803/m.42643 type:complete len:293 (+) Transcript_14803:1256-2134(+)
MGTTSGRSEGTERIVTTDCRVGTGRNSHIRSSSGEIGNSSETTPTGQIARAFIPRFPPMDDGTDPDDGEAGPDVEGKLIGLGNQNDLVDGGLHGHLSDGGNVLSEHGGTDAHPAVLFGNDDGMDGQHGTMRIVDDHASNIEGRAASAGDETDNLTGHLHGIGRVGLLGLLLLGGCRRGDRRRRRDVDAQQGCTAKVGRGMMLPVLQAFEGGRLVGRVRVRFDGVAFGQVRRRYHPMEQSAEEFGRLITAVVVVLVLVLVLVVVIIMRGRGGGCTSTRPTCSCCRAWRTGSSH